MLSYQHSYHAGNFADVLKHLTLIQLLEYLLKKTKPLFYLETHSGRGVYHLDSKESATTNEYMHGVNIIWENKENLPKEFNTYLNLLTKFNPDEVLKIYPGSPCIAMNILREIDRQYYCELHPLEYKYLSQLTKNSKKIHYSKEDGLLSLRAHLPPSEKRGLIFIDPSYEIKNDYLTIPKTLKESYQKFINGIYCIWYPKLINGFHLDFKQKLKEINPNNFLCIEFNSSKEQNMQGTGLFIINPTYKLEENMEIILKTLCNLFKPGISSYSIEFS